jgi:hypothetical protein
MKKQNDVGDQYIEFSTNGKTKRFNCGADLFQWAMQQNPHLETRFDEKRGPFLCDWFENRRRKS